jgi:hypothetical protein
MVGWFTSVIHEHTTCELQYLAKVGIPSYQNVVTHYLHKGIPGLFKDLCIDVILKGSWYILVNDGY